MRGSRSRLGFAITGLGLLGVASLALLPVEQLAPEPLPVSVAMLRLLSLIGRWADHGQLSEEGAKHRLIESVERETGCGRMMAPVIRLLQDIHNQGRWRKIENRGIEQAKQYIDDHYREPLTLQALSDRIYMNPAYFSVLFKKQIGKSMTQYLTERRLEKARELLQQPDRKTYQIAEEVGFENAAYFSTLFKKHTGFTPQEYRSLVE